VYPTASLLHVTLRYSTGARKNKTTLKQHILRVRRPAARQTHRTYDVLNVRCDSYFRQLMRQ